MKPLVSADLRHQLIVSRPTQTRKAGGGIEFGWTEVGRPWAEMIGLEGRESVMEKVLRGIAVRRLRIWYREDIDERCQVTVGGLVLNVRSVADPFGTRRELLIIADSDSLPQAA